jgi:hypothetical protein
MSRIAKASLLLFFFSLCGSAFVVTHQLRERVPPPLPRDLFAVVNDQVTALRASDYVSAYRHAATGVQQKFTLPQFERMARHSYGALERQRIEFGSAKALHTNLVHIEARVTLRIRPTNQPPIAPLVQTLPLPVRLALPIAPLEIPTMLCLFRFDDFRSLGTNDMTPGFVLIVVQFFVSVEWPVNHFTIA